MVRIEGDMTAFGIKLEGRRKAAREAGRWFRRVEGAEACMRNWHDAESCRAAGRQAKDAAVPRTVGTNTRRGGVGGGRGGEGNGGRGGREPRGGEGASCP